MKIFLAKIVLIVLIVSLAHTILAEAERMEIRLKKYYFTVEVSRTSEETSKGLMFREHLPHNKGMLFIFQDEKVRPFYMKNTIIPLDIIWIDKDKKIVFIKANAQPCAKDPCPSIYPDKKAMYVLELNAGVSDDIGLEIGDEVVFE